MPDDDVIWPPYYDGFFAVPPNPPIIVPPPPDECRPPAALAESWWSRSPPQPYYSPWRELPRTELRTPTPLFFLSLGVLATGTWLVLRIWLLDLVEMGTALLVVYCWPAVLSYERVRAFFSGTNYLCWSFCFIVIYWWRWWWSTELGWLNNNVSCLSPLLVCFLKKLI